jgi:hypothetical protein
MKRLVDLSKLDRLDRLIRMKSTGRPDELAKRLEMSRSTLFEFISFLRNEMNAPIHYNEYSLSYEYTYLPRFYLGFELDRLKETEMNNTLGGSGDKEPDK